MKCSQTERRRDSDKKVEDRERRKESTVIEKK